MKTIEDLAQISWAAWDRYWNRGGYRPGTPPKEAELEAHTLIAKAIITALAEDGVSWAPSDDD